MRAGDWVELRSPTEILATLDQDGCLEGVPFMPEMLSFFGRAFRVTAQVERACDTICYSGPRRVPKTVILDDLRCKGTAHGGCQAQCRLYWKEAWLRPSAPPPTAGKAAATGSLERVRDSEEFVELQLRVRRNVHNAESTLQEPRYRCQATDLREASELIHCWSPRSFVHELTSGNVGPRLWFRVMTRIVLVEIARRLRLMGRSQHPFRPKDLNGKTLVAPKVRGIQPGELVEVRSGREIAATLNESGKNKGLWFDREMLQYCGQTARVKTKVERFIDEGSGRLVELSSDAYILDNVVCQSTHSDERWFCPRAIYPWWRECWLRPLDQKTLEATEPPLQDATSSIS